MSTKAVAQKDGLQQVARRMRSSTLSGTDEALYLWQTNCHPYKRESGFLFILSECECASLQKRNGATFAL
jgi:hypothetical protein